MTAVIMGTTPISMAQSVISEESIQTAIQLSQKIKSEKLITENITSLDALGLDKLPPQIRLRHIRQYAHGRIAHSNTFDSRKILDIYEQTLKQVGTQRDYAIFELHRPLLEGVNLLDPGAEISQLIRELELATDHEDWFVASNAWLLISVINSLAADRNLALQEAHEAFKKIPNEISPYVTDAHILTLTSTTYLNNLLLNTELAIENTADLIARKQAAGYSIDGASLLNNLLYSLSKWRENEVSAHIAQTVLELEKTYGSNTPGLTEMRVALLAERTGDFEKALTQARQGLAVVEIAALKNSLSFLEVNSLIALDKTAEAKSKFQELRESSQADKNDFFTNIRSSKVDFHFAVNKGDKAEIYKLSNEMLDITTQELLKSYSADTAKLVASLENTKERQAEREAGLTREANLQRAKAEQRHRVNQLLLILLAILSLAASLAIIFARYRDNVSKELAIKTAEAEDADRMKSEFLGMVSHELRTPLNGIVGIADLLCMQAPTQDLRHKAGIILDSSNKLTHVIESIVDMSSIDGEKMQLISEPTNVQALVQTLEREWRPQIEKSGVAFTCFVQDSLRSEITIDKVRVRQCLNNLLSNAAKFTDKGRVHLHVTGKTLGSDETEVTMIVADTGQGMNESVQSKLFTPFLQADSTMTRKHGGAGLGLAITRNLSRMMGGDVTMVSAEGRGSEFTLTLRGLNSQAVPQDLAIEAASGTPAETQKDELVLDNASALENEPKPLNVIGGSYFTAQSQKSVLTDTPESEILDGVKVLIVEDEPANQEVIKLFIDPKGCKSQCSGNGVEALDVLNTQAVDIILMDIRMPTMDGIETTRAIRESGREYADTPIIALTADVSAENNAECMAAGVDIFLTKPIKAHDLLEAMRYVRLAQLQDNDHCVHAA